MTKSKKLIIQICIMALMMALSAVLKFFSFETDSYRISLFDVPLLLNGIVYGTIPGAVVALGADLIYGIFFSKYSFSILMTISTICWGISGSFFFRKKMNFGKLLIVVLITGIITTAINSVSLYIIYKEAMFVNLPTRIVTMLVKCPITTAITYVLTKKVVIPLFKRYN